MEWANPFTYFISLWWPSFSFAFAIYLFVFSVSAWKSFMQWY